MPYFRNRRVLCNTGCCVTLFVWKSRVGLFAFFRGFTVGVSSVSDGGLATRGGALGFWRRGGRGGVTGNGKREHATLETVYGRWDMDVRTRQHDSGRKRRGIRRQGAGRGRLSRRKRHGSASADLCAVWRWRRRYGNTLIPRCPSSRGGRRRSGNGGDGGAKKPSPDKPKEAPCSTSAVLSRRKGAIRFTREIMEGKPGHLYETFREHVARMSKKD